MGLNSKQYLAYQENIATGTEPARGTRRREQDTTTLQDKWAWYDSLDAEQRGRLRQEFEEENKNNQP